MVMRTTGAAARVGTVLIGGAVLGTLSVGILTIGVLGVGTAPAVAAGAETVPLPVPRPKKLAQTAQPARPPLVAPALTGTPPTRISRLPAWLAWPTMPSASIRPISEAARLYPIWSRRWT